MFRVEGGGGGVHCHKWPMMLCDKQKDVGYITKHKRMSQICNKQCIFYGHKFSGAYLVLYTLTSGVKSMLVQCCHLLMKHSLTLLCKTL